MVSINQAVAFCLVGFFLISCSDTVEDIREKAKEAYRKKDYEKARSLFEEACQKSDGESCFFRSKCFDSGTLEEKKDLYNRSCELGYDRGCLILGFYYSMDPKRSNVLDIPKSLQYFSKGCDLGNEVACRIYKNGLK